MFRKDSLVPTPQYISQQTIDKWAKSAKMISSARSMNHVSKYSWSPYDVVFYNKPRIRFMSELNQPKFN